MAVMALSGVSHQENILHRHATSLDTSSMYLLNNSG